VTDLGGNTLSSDCDGDALCDAIEIADNPALDCNDDGVLDSCEIATGAVDCNANSVLDACEITADPSLDLNGNGQLDICEANNFRFVPSAQFPTIQSAVATVPAGGVTVFVGAGTYAINASTGGGIDLTGKKVILRSSVGATQTILDGTGLDDSILKIFPLTVAANLSSNGSVIEGFTFRNGTKGNVAANRKGGAMFITGFNGAAIELTVRNCRFEDNASEFGGAIYAKDLLGSISLCDFNSNDAAPDGVGQSGGDGGSVQLFRGGWLFDGNVITGSSSANAGGALHIVGPLSATADCLLTNCAIAGNTAPIGSGVSWAQQGTLRVSAGGEHSVILKGNGGVACFGNNTFGQCTVPFNPGTTTTLSSISQTAAGASHTMASKPNVAAGFAPVICWGDNAFGQCTVPPSLIGVSVGQIAAGARHSMALTGTGAVVCWGDNAAGQCTVPGSLGIVAAVAGGDAHSMALRSDATVTCWGSNSFGQSSVPAGLIGVVQIAAGSRHSVVLTSSGTIVAWGDNTAGQCTQPAGLGAPVQIAAGGAHTVARLGNDTVVCWGDNAAGQCTIPAGLGPVAGIAAGSSHTVVRLMTGTQVLVCWGLNTSGQCTVTGSGYTDTLGPPLHVTNTLLQGNTGTSSAAFHTNGPLCFLLSNLILCDNAPANFFGCYEDLGDVRFSQDCDGDGVCDAEEILNGDEADTNGNFIPDDCELDPADLNGDGFINAADLSLLLSMWGSAGPVGDINGDGAINAADLALMLSVWGN
jgi:predicted outer membrane repeat protein